MFYFKSFCLNIEKSNKCWESSNDDLYYAMWSFTFSLRSTLESRLFLLVLADNNSLTKPHCSIDCAYFLTFTRSACEKVADCKCVHQQCRFDIKRFSDVCNVLLAFYLHVSLWTKRKPGGILQRMNGDGLMICLVKRTFQHYQLTLKMSLLIWKRYMLISVCLCLLIPQAHSLITWHTFFWLLKIHIASIDQSERPTFIIL